MVCISPGYMLSLVLSKLNENCGSNIKSSLLKIQEFCKVHKVTSTELKRIRH